MVRGGMVRRNGELGAIDLFAVTALIAACGRIGTGRFGQPLRNWSRDDS